MKEALFQAIQTHHRELSEKAKKLDESNVWDEIDKLPEGHMFMAAHEHRGLLIDEIKRLRFEMAKYQS